MNIGLPPQASLISTFGLPAGGAKPPVPVPTGTAPPPLASSGKLNPQPVNAYNPYTVAGLRNQFGAPGTYLTPQPAPPSGPPGGPIGNPSGPMPSPPPMTDRAYSPNYFQSNNINAPPIFSGGLPAGASGPQGAPMATPPPAPATPTPPPNGQFGIPGATPPPPAPTGMPITPTLPPGTVPTKSYTQPISGQLMTAQMLRGFRGR